jgi:hypothetical protein
MRKRMLYFFQGFSKVLKSLFCLPPSAVWEERKGVIGDTPNPGRETLHPFLAGGGRGKRGNWGHPKPRQGDPALLQSALMGDTLISAD